MELVGIKETAKLLNLSLETLRKYKSSGLIEPTKRVGRKDLYSPDNVQAQLKLIEAKKNSGKSIKEIVAFLKYLRSREELSSIPNKKILIADGNEAVLGLIAECLEELKKDYAINIALANNGIDALELAKAMNPDLIILDVALPAQNGKQVYNKIKGIDSLSKCKFIILTNSIIFNPDGTTMIVKPFYENELLLNVKSIISSS